MRKRDEWAKLILILVLIHLTPAAYGTVFVNARPIASRERVGLYCRGAHVVRELSVYNHPQCKIYYPHISRGIPNSFK